MYKLSLEVVCNLIAEGAIPVEATPSNSSHTLVDLHYPLEMEILTRKSKSEMCCTPEKIKMTDLPQAIKCFKCIRSVLFPAVRFVIKPSL